MTESKDQYMEEDGNIIILEYRFWNTYNIRTINKGIKE